eukprot:TRINITY_DN10224_c0_g4_i1.p1 TRINITY_DN10224_c0_g4~~TRINITY_DN10224_c0_g4_i1.p1  ORF type:complete len:487 (+),score=62.79 TRINITY_DN10224_c0_g4_i1:247-1707(+)
MAFMLHCWAFGSAYSRAWSLVPPSGVTTLEALRLVRGFPVDRKRLGHARTGPGFFTMIGSLIYLTLMGLYVVETGLAVGLAELTKCTDADTTLLHAYREVTCLVGVYVVCVVLICPCFCFLDVLVHQIHWTGNTQLAVFDSMKGRKNWHKYRLASGAWVEIELIAAGSEGEVHLAEIDREGSIVNVCVKIPHLDGMSALEQTLEETAVWIRVQEDADPEDPGLGHIVPLVGFCFDLPVEATLLMHCDGGDLLHRLHGLRQTRKLSKLNLGLDEDDAEPGIPLIGMRESLLGLDEGALLSTRLRWALEVAIGLRTVHRQGIAHLDLKSDNVLLHAGTAYLTDFGMAAEMQHSATGEVYWWIPACTGTLAFMAPEVYVDMEEDAPQVKIRVDEAFAADIFSFGFLLYECVTFEREPLCRRTSAAPLRELVPVAPLLQPGEMKLEGEDPPPEGIVQLVKRCMAQNPPDRPEMEEVIAELEACVAGLTGS